MSDVQPRQAASGRMQERNGDGEENASGGQPKNALPPLSLCDAGKWTGTRTQRTGTKFPFPSFFSPQKNFFSLHSLRRLNGKTTCNHPQERLSYPLSGEDDGKKTPSGQQAVFLFSPGKVSLLPREILLIFSWRSIRADILKKRQESNAASITDI